ncbi:endo alpha-1,4 polygalactosaminidase [Maridesulfovibrio sp.]|uniref:endo alpha-1,4 polygalactosaminidase n=1 Tax=Maridesulfovibrio sp. TaxID=2795000 RepID=UPI0029CA12E2|nr:endo alpha-1,4 polygalactosaminidase [Maridesulfovibrio sp.]
MYGIPEQRCTGNSCGYGDSHVFRFCAAVALLVAAFSLFGSLFAFGGSNAVNSWACYYGSEDRTDKLSGFDLLIVTPNGQDPVPLRAKGRKVLVYVSLGEVAAKSPYYEEAKSLGLLVRHNDNWDSWVVDVRRPQWQELLFTRIIPDALAAGYDGLFFDTLDSPIDMQRRDPDTYKGTERACVDLVRSIRKRFPKLLLCQNRGFEIISRTAPYLNYLLIEGLSSSMDIATSTRSDVPQAARDFLIAKAKAALKANPKLVVLTLDYVPAGDKLETDKAYKFSRKLGFVPYVSTPALNEVFIHAVAE